MFRQLTSVLLFASILYSTRAEEGWLFNRLSPDLQKFMVAHPAALTVLTNAFSESFSNRSVQMFYFYSTNEADVRAAHYYPGAGAGGTPEVFITIRENQRPIDQFITLLFEILNTRNERHFRNLFEDAYNGSVSKEVFVATIGRLEFGQTLETRALLKPLRFTRKEIKQSDYYERLMNCPTNYDGFVEYQRTSGLKRDPRPDKYYEDEYDRVRKLKPNSKHEQSKGESEHAPPEKSTPTPPPRP